MVKKEHYDGLKYIAIIVIVLLIVWWTISDNGRVKYIKKLETQIEKYEEKIEELEKEKESISEELEYYYWLDEQENNTGE